MFELQNERLAPTSFDDVLLGTFPCARRILTFAGSAADAFKRSERTSPDHSEEFNDSEPDTAGDGR